ncbi:hypothetical protein ACGFWD_23445 [Streptomyces sp. NPDC048448]|uniref:hypothetical protein n=1 Tax=unclassified Streptomyces TaxID=2593676 RepID=UPI002E328D25|nr:hypothetical protein [Streptomyces sp. NBC_01455]
MLALRLARGAHPLVQLRRLLVAAASAGTGFLLLSALGYAMAHPDASTGSVLRLLWCLAPLAASVHLAVAVARTDPGTRPRPGLAAVGLGPGRLMAFSAVTTALSTTLGSMLALLVFLHLRGDLTGMPFDGAATAFLAADQPLPLPAALTLLLLVPVAASLASAVALRPRSVGPGRAGRPAATAAGAPGAPGTPGDPAPVTAEAGPNADHLDLPPDPRPFPPPLPAPAGLPWGTAVVAAGLAVESYASRSGAAPGSDLTSRFAGSPAGVLGGWALTAVGLALAGPAITHVCGWLLQAVRPGALRLLAGRGLQGEARRIGRPLGVVCAVASGAYAMATVYAGARPSIGPLSTLGALLVAGCAVATLFTAALETKQARADTTAALLRLGAPASVLRNAALLRAGVLLAVFGPLTWLVAELAAMPLAR